MESISMQKKILMLIILCINSSSLLKSGNEYSFQNNDGNWQTLQAPYGSKPIFSEIKIQRTVHFEKNTPNNLSETLFDLTKRGIEQGIITGIASPVAQSVNWGLSTVWNTGIKTFSKLSLVLNIREKTREEFIMEINEAHQKIAQCELQIKELTMLGHVTEQELEPAKNYLSILKMRAETIEKNYSQHALKFFEKMTPEEELKKVAAMLQNKGVPIPQQYTPSIDNENLAGA